MPDAGGAAEGGGGVRKRFDAYKKHHALTNDVRDNIPFRVIPCGSVAFS